MPDTLIKQYIVEAEKYGAKVAIIGLIDNDFALTKARIGEIVGESNRGGVIIDPNLFTTYKVESVPAILLTADNYPCQSTECIADKFDIMYGAVHLQYALEAFQNEGDLRDVAANKLKARQG
jgi:type-F conjugative transfer system pilin assembly protein TrbC